MRRTTTDSAFGPGVAIIGMGCLLPGGIDSPQALWKFLCEGREGISEVPPDRWNNTAVYDPDPGTPGRTATRRAGFVTDVAGFDAAFFGISPREAAVMDPQQRMLLETTWLALEDAGVPAEKLSGSKTGVYVGISHSDYHGIQKFGRPEIDVHTSTGGALSIASNRLSHRFNLRGPSLSVDTACSSSLVALDLACAALQRGECEMALVGGANAILTPDVTITFSRASMLSPDGRCKAFDARANGYVRAEGAAMVVLKPLDRALADNDRIYAVIRSTAVNQDGQTTTITVPSRTAQIEMLEEACRRAAIDPAQIGYVEAHGTGTPVGDPIEAEAIGTVFGKPRPGIAPCLIGSIKTNIGHLEPAAGIAGLIKATLCVQHGSIPPHLHFETPNPNIRFQDLGIEICRTQTAFPDRAIERIAAVNSFGFGGTNACAIVQQPPLGPAEKPVEKDSPWPFTVPLSAANRNALEALAARVADAVSDESVSWPDAVGTLALRRSHLEHRAVVIARSREDAVTHLRSIAHKEAHAGVISGRRRSEPRTAFVFTGQGAHWWAMGRGLLESDPVFRQTVERCDEAFRALSGTSIIAELMASEEKSKLDHTIVAQPATFALQLGLAARWKQWGILPGAVVGHSIGEMAAACVAGALSFEDAIKVVFHRSRLQEQMRLQGGMAAVGLSAKEAGTMLDDMRSGLEIAAINAPELVTVAGSSAEIERLLAELAVSRSDVFARRLHVDYAFHSRQMDAFEAELRANLDDVASQRGGIPMFSTVTGRAVEPNELTAEYWWRNMRFPVLFRDAVDTAIEAGFNTFVELGAHPVLTGPVRSCLAHHGREGTIVGSLHRDEPDVEAMTKALAQLHVSGVAIDWPNVVQKPWNFTELPGQRFEKSKFWAESEESVAARMDGPVHPLLGYRLKTSTPVWQAYVNPGTPRFLVDHSVGGTVVFPAAGYVELILAAGRELLGALPWEIENVSFHEALVLGPHEFALLQTSVDTRRGSIEVTSRVRGRDAGWNLRASARLRNWSGTPSGLKPWQPNIEPPVHFERDRFYRQLRMEGHDFGPAFRGVDIVWREKGEVLGLVNLPADAASPRGYLMHPALLDACFQTIRGFRDIDGADSLTDATIALPISIGRLRLFKEPGPTVYCRTIAVEEKPTEIAADLTVIDEAGAIVAMIEGFRCRRVAKSREQHGSNSLALYQERWIEIASLDPASSAAPVAGAGGWLILCDRRGLGARIAQLLAERGIPAVRVYAANAYRELGGGEFEAPPHHDALAAVLAAVSSPISHILHLWTLDHRDGPLHADAIRASQDTGTAALLALTRAAAALESKPKLVIATAGATSADGKSKPGRAAIQHASLAGAARSIGNEFPEMKPRVIDLDPDYVSAETLLREAMEDSETEIAIRGGTRYGSRLERVAEEALPLSRVAWNTKARTPSFRLTMTSPGVLENLILREMPAPTPDAGQVVVEVHAVGLNFRDVMAATGLLPAEAEEQPAWQNLGFECAGLVRSVGSGVDPALAGRRVVAVTSGSFASHVCVSAALVFPVPDQFTFAQAAALPTAYATAQYSLVTIARIRAGDRVLIHSATGGVGLAAISVARKHGAEIIATAGSDEKRDYLRRLGIKHVFGSRSLDFADEVLAATSGRGVDIVLNSLPGPFLEKGLSVLAPGGRFLEIGKRDVYADTAIGLKSLRRNAAFFAIDLARLAVEQPQALRAELEGVFADLVGGGLQLLPTVDFSITEAAEAFRHMARARHIGKVVVSLDGAAPSVETHRDIRQIVRAEAAYLVTGGLAGFGLATARWLVEQGVRHLVLVGRSGGNEESAAAIDEMRAAGATVVALAADTSVFEDARRVIDEIGRQGVPLRGIVHAAGVIDDALVSALEPERIERVFAPKVMSAWHLHELTLGMPLDFFVCYSSVAAALGSVGQAHYAAANAALDAFAAMRNAQGLPGLSIGWGAIGDVGYLRRNSDVARYLQQTGVGVIPVQDALTALGRLLGRDCGRITFANINWSLLARSSPALLAAPRTAALAALHADDKKSGQQLRAQLLGVAAAARAPIVTRFVREQIASVLKSRPDAVELDRPLVEVGLDSLTSFELKNRIEAELGTSLTIGAFLQRPTARHLVNVVLEKLDTAASDPADARSAGAAALEPTMSVGQEALWFVEQIAPGNPAYGLAMCIGVRPQPDESLINTAFQHVVARHECLRLSFPSDATGPVPTEAAPETFRLNFIDATGWDETELRQALDRSANMPFDLAGGPLIHLHLYRRPDRDILLLHAHHIIADAMSIAIVVQQMFEAYFALRAGQPVRWGRPARSFAAYAVAQRKMLETSAGEQHRAFWREQLLDAPRLTTLPTDFPRPDSQRGRGASTNIVIPRSLGRALSQLAQREGTTLFTLLFSAFNIFLHRVGGNRDLVIGVPAGGRTRAELEDCVGYLVNPLPIRTTIEDGLTIRQLLSKSDVAVRSALSHQEFPFSSMVRDLELGRDPTHSPIFQVMFAMERSAVIDSHGLAVTLLNTEGASIAIREFNIEVVAVRRDRAQFDLTFVLEEFDGQIYGVIDYRADLWKPSTIESFASRFQSILEEVAESIERPCQSPSTETPAGRSLTGPALPEFPDISDAIFETARQMPDRIAVEAVDGRLTYRELAARIGTAAAALRACGIGPGSIVGLCLARTSALPVAMAAVLEAGAAYAPLDANQPAARLGRIVEDAAPQLMIVDQEHAALVAPLTSCPLITFDALTAPAPAGDRARERSELCYVIHTSGSTGVPVGVEVRRDSLSSFAAAMARELPLTADDTILAVTTVSFDIAALELLLPLTLGARVVVADGATARDGGRLVARVAEGDITAMQATPATWQMMLDAGWAGTRRFLALVGGERLHPALAGKLLEKTSALYNMYGPTETTIWSTCAEIVQGSDDVPIGHPIANTICRIVDENLKPVPHGAVGELLIGGLGVARGYRNDPKRTDERFVPDPIDADRHGRCFRTGDFVSINQVGELIFHGRRDQQVKIRGFRVELGEVEAAASSHPAIREAAAVLHGTDLSRAKIVVYATRAAAASCDESALANHLKSLLPPYMVPASVVLLDRLPRLPNGKLDRARLAAEGATTARRLQPASAPRNETEEKLWVIAKSVLDIDDVGVDDDFFAVGGTSLLAMRYLARVSDVFGVHVGPNDIIRAPTVATLAELITARSAEEAPLTPAGTEPDRLPATLWRPLALARAEGTLAGVDAAAIAYLPDDIFQFAPFQAALEKMRRSGRSRPHWAGHCGLSLGNIALIVAPVTGRELFTDPDATRAHIDEAVAYAARLGARTVSLTGLIPAATDFGTSLSKVDGVELTTGHAATAVSMGLTIQSAAAAAARDLRRARMCFVGLGAIGTATLRTVLGCLPHPASLTLCDVPAKRDYLEALAREARMVMNFSGEISIVESAGSLPEIAYEADWFVGATNATGVIDIACLRPGSIIVDDSFPLCFDLAAARRRLESAGDVLFVNGGSVGLNEPLRWTCALPAGVPSVSKSLLAQAMLPSSEMITGCIVSSVLPRDGFAPTCGPVALDHCRIYWHGFHRLGLAAAPLHCGSWSPSALDLERFRSVAASSAGHSKSVRLQA